MISRNSINGPFPKKKLGEVVEFLDSQRRPVTESERRPGPYPYYGANGQQGTIDGYIFNEPLVLLAEDGGHFTDPQRGIAYRISGKTWVNNHAHVLRPKADTDLAYLCRVLENYDVTPFITGTTRGKLTQAGAAEIVIPLPPLAEQRRIAEVLDWAEALRAKRRAALVELGALTQSLFLDLFGDPLRNPRGWPTFRFAEVCETTQGVQIPRDEQKEEPSEGYERYLYINDFYSDDSPKYVEDHYPQKRVTDDDLVMANTGSPGRVFKGRAGILSNNLFKITFDTLKISTVFFYHFLASDLFQRHLQAQMKQGIQSHLGHKTFGVQKLPIPPIELQHEFARRVTTVEALKTTQRASLAELNALFASLQHRAFRGEV